MRVYAYPNARVGVTHVLTSAGLLDVVMGALAHLPAVQHVAVVGAPGCGLGASAPLPACGVPGDARARPFVIPYSSGTTGLPKGVVLTHGNITANVAQVRRMHICAVWYFYCV